MDLLRSILFESRAQLAALSLVLMGAAYALWLRMSPPGRSRVWAGAAGLIAALFVIQSTVVTDRERVRSALDGFVSAIEKRDERVMAEAIDADFDSDGIDQAGMLRYVLDAARKLEVRDSRLGSVSIRIDGDLALVELAATATVRLDGTPFRAAGKWDLSWARRGECWKLLAARPIEINGQPVAGLRSIRRW